MRIGRLDLKTTNSAPSFVLASLFLWIFTVAGSELCYCQTTKDSKDAKTNGSAPVPVTESKSFDSPAFYEGCYELSITPDPNYPKEGDWGLPKRIRLETVPRRKGDGAWYMEGYYFLSVDGEVPANCREWGPGSWKIELSKEKQPYVNILLLWCSGYESIEIKLTPADDGWIGIGTHTSDAIILDRPIPTCKVTAKRADCQTKGQKAGSNTSAK